MREIFFTLDRPTILLNRLLRMHWTARRKHMQELSWLVRAAVTPPRTPLAPCEVYIKRYSVQVPDHEGATGGVKLLLDCLVVHTKTNPWGNGLIENDDPSCIIRLDVVPIKVAHRADARTEITIREC